MAESKWSRSEMAARVARDIPDGAVVNLGIGLPTMVANHLPQDREVVLHSENGVIGMGPAPREGEEDFDLINAGKQPVTLLPGGVFFHHADSFAMDLAIGAKKTYVMMEHTTKSGEPKVVERCTYPLTGIGCVTRIYTDLAVIDVTPRGLVVVESVDGLPFDTLQARTGAPLARA